MKTLKTSFLSAVLFLGACIISCGLAFGSYYYYQWLNSFIHTQNSLLSALLFSSFLIVLGLIIVLWRPKFFGFQIGESLKKWWLTPIFIVLVCGFTVLCLSFVERTPYSGANWIVEMILVPFSEEMIWRGVIFSLLFYYLGNLYAKRTQLILTILYSSVAFGLAHSSNMLVHPISFVIMQMAFAAITGIGMGYIRAKTKSIYPAMILHAAFNLVVILY